MIHAQYGIFICFNSFISVPRNSLNNLFVKEFRRDWVPIFHFPIEKVRLEMCFVGNWCFLNQPHQFHDGTLFIDMPYERGFSRNIVPGPGELRRGMRISGESIALAIDVLFWCLIIFFVISTILSIFWKIIM